MFSPTGLVLGGTDGIGSRFYVLRSRTRLGRHRGRRVQFSYFALPDTFSVEPRASVPVFMFCDPGLVWGGNEGAGSHFQVLRSQNCLGTYQRCRVPFSSFALPDTFLEVPSALGPIFLFCAPRLIFDGTEVVGA
jgi:hypothetical protein